MDVTLWKVKEKLNWWIFQLQSWVLRVKDSTKQHNSKSVPRLAFQLPTGSGDKQSVLWSWSLCTWTNCLWEKTVCFGAPLCSLRVKIRCVACCTASRNQSSFPVVIVCARPCLPNVQLHLEALDRIHTLCHTAMTHGEAERKRDAHQHGQHNSHPPE